MSSFIGTNIPMLIRMEQSSQPKSIIFLGGFENNDTINAGAPSNVERKPKLKINGLRERNLLPPLSFVNCRSSTLSSIPETPSCKWQLLIKQPFEGLLSQQSTCFVFSTCLGLYSLASWMSDRSSRLYMGRWDTLLAFLLENSSVFLHVVQVRCERGVIHSTAHQPQKS